MTALIVKESDVVSDTNVWTKDSQLMVRVRKHGKRDDLLIVDITEMTYKKTSRSRAVWAACNAVRNLQFSTDPVVLLDQEIEKKVKDGNEQIHVVRIRQSSYAFVRI